MKSTREIIRSELIEIIIPANSNNQPKTKIQFPDNQNLRNAFFLGIETYTVEEVPKSILTSSEVIPKSLAQSIFVTFQGYDGNNFSQQIPYLDLNTLHIDDTNEGGLVVRNDLPPVYTKQRVNWPKSYIEIADASLISEDDAQSVLFNVYYRYNDDVEKTSRETTFGTKK